MAQLVEYKENLLAHVKFTGKTKHTPSSYPTNEIETYIIDCSTDMFFMTLTGILKRRIVPHYVHSSHIEQIRTTAPVIFD
jgi:hypothetical protein